MTIRFSGKPHVDKSLRYHEVTQVSQLCGEIRRASHCARWYPICRSIRWRHRLCCGIFAQGHSEPHR